MNLDLGSFAFGSYLNSGSGTPSWGTALGQSKPDYKFTYPGSEVLLIGMVYCSVPLDNVSLPLGKGGHIYQASELEECQLASLFRKVYINGIRINYPFVMVLVKENSDSHSGRKSIKYSDKNAYQSDNEHFSNQEFVRQTRISLGLTGNACWFVYSIEIYNQDELHMFAVVVDKDSSVTYANSSVRRDEWIDLIPKKDFAYIDKQKYTELNSGILQQIFYGAPGTGKSHEIKKLTRGKEVIRTTFHPDTDYSTFVGCYKPTSSRSCIRGKQPILDYDSLVDKFKEYLNVPNVNITKACTLFGFDYHDSIIRIQENGRKVMDLVNDAYKSNTSYDSVVRGGMACYEQNPIQENGSKITYEYVPQAFTNAYVKAWNTDENVYLIIEEINRGNCAQIFGDLFQLLDRKNGVSEYPVEADTDLQNYLSKVLAKTSRTDIPEDVKSGKKLMLPANLYIWATMNTSDQSLFPIDSAFKRRWEWKYIKIKEGKDENGNKLDWKVDVKMDESGTLLSWWDFIKKINEIIASMTSSADKQLGYFFYCAKDGVIDEETFVSKVIFYLWNDVFKDYGFEDASLFRYTTKDEDGKEMEKDLSFPDFYDEEGEKVNTEQLTDFVKKVMSWRVDDKRDDDK